MSATFMIAAVGSYVGGCSRKNEREEGREGVRNLLKIQSRSRIVYTGDDTHAVLPLHSLNILYVLN